MTTTQRQPAQGRSERGPELMRLGDGIRVVEDNVEATEAWNGPLFDIELVVAEYLDEPEEYDAPRCGPGPFSMANADTVTDVLTAAGYEDIRLARVDLPYKVGNDLDQAVEMNMAIGPAAEVLRLWGDRVDELRPKIQADLRAALADCVTDGGAVFASSSTWVATAEAPR